MTDYKQKALLFAERYGIINYKVNGSKMVYYESFSSAKYKAVVNLKTMVETRKQIFNKM